MKICKFLKNVNDILKPHDTSFHCVLNKILDTRLGLRKIHLLLVSRLYQAIFLRIYNRLTILRVRSETVKLR